MPDVSNRAARHCGGPRQSHLQTRSGHQVEDGRQQLAELLNSLPPSFESCPVKLFSFYTVGSFRRAPRKPGTDKRQEARRAKKGQNWPMGQNRNSENCESSANGGGPIIFKVFTVLPPAKGPRLNFENYENGGGPTILKVFRVC